MSITLSYQPDNGVSIDEALLLWDADRLEVRSLLNDKYKVDDSVIDLALFNEGDSSQNIFRGVIFIKTIKGKTIFSF
jgi:hypothetical protein